MNCLFCGSEETTGHHVLPKRVKRIMGWNGKQAEKANANKKIYLCLSCHDKMTTLQEPLIKIISYLVLSQVPEEFYSVMDEVCDRLNGKISIEKQKTSACSNSTSKRIG